MKYTKKSGIAKIPILLILLSIGILIGVFFYIFDPLRPFFVSLDTQRKDDLIKIQQALEFYYRDFGKYPDYQDALFTMKIPDKNLEWGKEFKPYMELLPKDPSFYKRYAYWVDRENNFQSYRLYTALERPELDKSACQDEAGCKGVPFQDMCGSYAVCNFGLTSGNISP